MFCKFYPPEATKNYYLNLERENIQHTTATAMITFRTTSMRIRRRRITRTWSMPEDEEYETTTTLIKR